MLKELLAGTIVVTALPFILPGCSSSGSIKNPSIRYDGFEITLPSIEWGPKAPLPAGSTFDCYAEVNGQPVQLYTAPSGAHWFIDADGDAHPVVTGDVDCPGSGNTSSPDPQHVDDDINLELISTHALDYQFNDSNNTAFVSFTIPADNTWLYRDSPQLPFTVSETTHTFVNGDMSVTYNGTMNDVLGALWWVGIREIDFTDANGVDVNVQFDPNMNVVTIDTTAGSEFIVMTPTVLSNWPL